MSRATETSGFGRFRANMAGGARACVHARDRAPRWALSDQRREALADSMTTRLRQVAIAQSSAMPNPHPRSGEATAPTCLVLPPYCSDRGPR